MTALTLPAALILPSLAALIALNLSWPRRPATITQLALRASLALGLGLGLSSVTYFGWLLVFGASRAFIWIEVIVLVLLGGLWAVRRSARRAAKHGDAAPAAGALAGEPLASAPATRDLWISKTLAGSYILALTAWVASFVSLTLAHPHGNWDATTIWNLRARFLFRGAAHWSDAFSELLGIWTHTDYPLLLSAAVARVWSFIMSDATIGPAAIAFLFTLGTIALLTGAVALLRGAEQGMLAGIVLMGTEALIRQGPTQYADIPLGYFILASFVLLVLSERSARRGRLFLVLAGLMAGLAAWSKNEGLLFLPALFAGYGAVTLLHEGWRHALRRCGTIFLGLLPLLTVIVGFKAFIAPANDLVAALEPSAALRLADLSRYAVVGERFASRFVSTGGWMLGLGLAIYLALLGASPDPRDRSSRWAMGTTVVLILIGYFLVYVLTPHDLDWHLRVSLYRLMLHVWPALVLLFFLIVRPPLLGDKGRVPSPVPGRPI